MFRLNYPKYKYRIKKKTYHNGKINFFIESKINYIHHHLTKNEKIIKIITSPIMYFHYLINEDTSWTYECSRDTLENAITKIMEFRERQMSDIVIEEKVVKIWRNLK